MKTVYLHIGFGKTGTTSIQDYFFWNSQAHLDNEILYPKTGLRGSGHHNLAPLGENSLSAEMSSLYIELVDEIKGDQREKVLISSEFFCFTRPMFICDMSRQFSEFNVKVIFYIRDQVPLIQSTYLQWQKVAHDYKGSIENFFSSHAQGFDFQTRLQPWEEYFGRENIKVRLFDKRVIGNDVRKDMMTLMRLSKSHHDIETESYSNESIIPELSYIISLMDKSNISETERKKFIDYCLELSGKYKTISEHSLLDDTLKTKIRDRYAQSNEIIADKYLDATQHQYFMKAVN